MAFFPHATLKEPQKNTTLLILHGIFSKFNLWLLDTKYNLQESSHVLVCVQVLEISRMIVDACLNEKQAYDYGRAYNQIKNKNLGG